MERICSKYPIERSGWFGSGGSWRPPSGLVLVQDLAGFREAVADGLTRMVRLGVPAALDALIAPSAGAARRISGNCARHQRKVTLAIKRARTIALLPFTVTA